MKRLPQFYDYDYYYLFCVSVYLLILSFSHSLSLLLLLLLLLKSHFILFKNVFLKKSFSLAIDNVSLISPLGRLITLKYAGYTF